MHHLLNFCGIATATVALAAVMPSAIAQENTWTYTCQAVGNGTAEPLGNREGHTISVSETSCVADSGPFAGGVLTNTNIWEWDKTNGVLLSGQSVLRKPGATAISQTKEGKIALMVADGKVTGITASGRTTYVFATGSAASLAGKSVTWTTKPGGPGQFKLEIKME